MFKIPNYNLLRYEYDNIDSCTFYTSYYIPLIRRYESHMNELIDWLYSLSDLELTMIGLLISRDTREYAEVGKCVGVYTIGGHLLASRSESGRISLIDG